MSLNKPNFPDGQTFHKCMNICIYRYYTMTDVCTTALLPIKPSLHDDSTFRHGFEVEASLPLSQSNNSRYHQTLLHCHIHTDPVRTLSWTFPMYFLLSDGKSPRLFKKTEFELIMKPRHATSIGNTLVIQPFLTHCSRRFSYFSNLQ